MLSKKSRTEEAFLASKLATKMLTQTLLFLLRLLYRQEAERLDQEARGKLERQRIDDEARAEEARRGLLELQVELAALESTGQAKAE
ncbi:unnamed protein product, partial [Dibothriocephalus latus]